MCAWGFWCEGVVVRATQTQTHNAAAHLHAPAIRLILTHQSHQRREQAAAELKAEMARIRARAFRRAASAETAETSKPAA